MQKKFILFFTLVFLILTLASSYTYADNLQENKQKLNDVNSNMQQKKKDLQNVQGQQKDIQNQIVSIQSNLIDTQKKLDDTNKNIGKIENNIKIVTDQLNAEQKKLDDENSIFKKRTVAMYESGPTGYLGILLDSNSFMDFISRYQIIKRLVAFDVNLIKDMDSQKQVIQKKQDDLAYQKKNLVLAKGEIEQRKRDINIQLASRSGLLRQLNNKASETKSQINSLSEESEQLDSIIRNLQKQQEAKAAKAAPTYASSGTNVNYSGGKLLWPVPSCSLITSPFGSRLNPFTGTYGDFHPGIDIGAGYGSTVVAAADGTVILAGWFGGYGNCVIIDHGSGVSTLYGHNSQLLVSEGQHVKRGQAVSLSGSTGSSTGPHVHFGVMVNGNWVDPMGWLK